MTGAENDPLIVAREEDRVARMVARTVARTAPAALELDSPAGEAYADWLATEARLAASALERRRDARTGRDLAARVLARRRLERVAEHGFVARPRESLAAYVAERPLPLTAAVEEGVGTRRAPLLELSVAAGAGRELWEQECDRWVELPPALPRGRHVALGVSGDSMEPLLAAGDTVLVRLGHAPASGAVVVAHLADDGYVVKQVGRITARTIELRSLNPAYAPVRVRREAGTVLGTVVLAWGRRSP